MKKQYLLLLLFVSINILSAEDTISWLGKSYQDILFLKTTLSASSTLNPALSYGGQLLFDGNTSTAWVEGEEGQGEGSTLQLDFLSTGVEIDRIMIASGYQRSGEHFLQNSRPRDVTVSLNDGRQTFEFTLEDSPGVQTLQLGKSVLVKDLKLRINSVYPGTRYQDTCISELWFRNANRDIVPYSDGLLKVKDSYRQKIKSSLLKGYLPRRPDDDPYGLTQEWLTLVSPLHDSSARPMGLDVHLGMNGWFYMTYGSLIDNKPVGNNYIHMEWKGSWVILEYEEDHIKIKLSGLWKGNANPETGEEDPFEKLFSDTIVISVEKYNSNVLYEKGGRIIPESILGAETTQGKDDFDMGPP